MFLYLCTYTHIFIWLKKPYKSPHQLGFRRDQAHCSKILFQMQGAVIAFRKVLGHGFSMQFEFGSNSTLCQNDASMETLPVAMRPTLCW